MEKVTAAKSAGFCFGVARAVRMAEELAAAAGRPRMLGHVIHNDHEIARLAALGLTAIQSRVRGWWMPPAPGWHGSTGSWRRRRERAGSR